jgi:hypothetical protein
MNHNLQEHRAAITRSVRSMASLLLFAACGLSSVAVAQKPSTIPEKIEWTWEVKPDPVNPHLPNVLILGDSISRNYYPEVVKNLNGIANVYLMASSTSVGDPRIEIQIAEFASTERVRFSVVHFNNGMHGWAYTEAQYGAEFPKYLRAVRNLVKGNEGLIWASTTPVRSDADTGGTNPRIEQRNRIALPLIRAAGIPVDDQSALMQHHQDLHEDAVHYNADGAKIQGDQASAMIRNALKASDSSSSRD